MKVGNGDHFEQAAADTETYLVVGQLGTDAPNDKQQLNPVLESIPAEVVEPENVLAGHCKSDMGRGLNSDRLLVSNGESSD